MNKSERTFKPIVLKSIALPAIVIALGLQTLRVFLPSLAWYLKDTVGVGSAFLGIYAIGTFLVGYLAALLRRLAGPKLSLWLAAGAVAALRLAEQVIFNPALDLWLSLAGTALFVVFLPLFIGHVRAQGGRLAAPRIAYGLAMGLALDSLIHGAAGTLDLSWIPGVVPILVVAVLAALVFWLLAVETFAATSTPSDTPGAGAVVLAAIGPYLLLQLLIFQNQGWIAELGNLQPQIAFLVVMVGNLLVALGMFWAFNMPSTFHLPLGIAVAVFIGLVGYTADLPKGFLISMIFAQFVFGWSWALLSTLTAPAKRSGLARTTASVASGMLLFLLLAFIYYVSLDIALPIPRSAIIPTAAILLALAILYGSDRVARLTRSPWTDITPSLAALAMLIVPLVYWLIVGKPPEAVEPTGLPVKVMTYNVHSAFDVDGRQDPEAIAREIEASGADIVALQEMSRGWLIDGSTDLAAWLSYRLDMPVLFKGTTGPMWGNAILSRYPIVDHGWGELPEVDTLLWRGYLWAQIDVGGPEPLMVIATHLHHVEEDNYVRLEQVPPLLEFWADTPYSLIMGDMNAQPTYPEIDLFRQAGLIDSWEEAGEGEGLTFTTLDLYERIDWIWHSTDLAVNAVEVIYATASDHLPVLAEVGLAETGP
ncbi:MAG: endonuclease/exonuclease/phosphatase family protein [Anaerolineales bacterium]|jgi:endonuclease/exonuclease/phosphatase family metal-dependent hydrolase